MKTENVFAGIILTGLIAKLMHWPFSGPLLVVGLGVLSILYLAGSFYFFSDEKISRQNLALSIVSGFFLANACNGILFKLMFWPFSGPTLMVAITTVPVILGVTFLLKSTTKRTDLTTYYNNMIKRFSVTTVMVILFFFTSSSNLVKIIHSDDPEWVRLQIRVIENPENEEYKSEYNQYVNSLYLKHKYDEEVKKLNL